MNAPGVEELFAALDVAPHAHDLYQTLRRIDALHPELPRLGKALRASAEAVRLGQDPEFHFAPGNISSFLRDRGPLPRIGVRFMGLFGPNGALPLHLTEHARDRARNHGDLGLIAFSDIFHHRLLALFYRSWAQAQPTVHADRRTQDRFASWLGALAGLAAPELMGGDAIPVDAKRYQVGWLGRGVKSVEGLEGLLSGYFGMRFRVESFVGHWMTLRDQDRPRLGPHVRLQARLARNAVAGGKVWDRQHKFRIHAGPLSWLSYCSLLPWGEAQTALRDWVRQYAGVAMAWDLRLGLAGAELRALCVIGDQPMADGTRFRLGYNTWLGGRPRGAPGHADRTDLTFDPEQVRRR